MDSVPLDQPAVIICNDARGSAALELFSGQASTKLFIHPQERWIAVLRFDRDHYRQLSGPPMRVLAAAEVPTENLCQQTYGINVIYNQTP